MLERTHRNSVLSHTTPSYVRLARLQREGANTRVSAAAEFAPDDTAGPRQWLKDNLPVSTNWINAYCGFHPGGHRLVRADLPCKDGVIPPAAARSALATDESNGKADWSLGLVHPLHGGKPTTKDGMQDTLIVGLPTSEVSQHQRQLLKQHLRPARLELDTLCTLGALSRHVTEKLNGQATALCVFGRQETILYVVDREGIHPQKPVPFGLNTFAESTQRELKLETRAETDILLNTPDDALRKNLPRLLRIYVSHLRLCLDYFEHQTGRTVRSLLPSHLPAARTWLGPAIAESIDLPLLPIDLEPWAQEQNLILDPLPGALADWFSTLTLATTPQTQAHAEAD